MALKRENSSSSGSKLKFFPPGKILICTICSRDKDRQEGCLPAIKRYNSPRIDKVFSLAQEGGHAFAILSGKYGLLSPEDPIPYYDKLLKEEDVGEVGTRAAAYLKEGNFREVVLLLPDPAIDPNIVPYIETMKRAGEIGGVPVGVRFVPPYSTI